MNENRLNEINEQLKLLLTEIENATIENVPDCAAKHDLITNLKDSHYWASCWLSFVKYHNKRGNHDNS